MIVYRNRLIFGVVGMIISTVFQAVYAVISFLKLQFVFLVSILWAILYFVGMTAKYPILNLFLSLALIASVMYAVVSILKALLGIDNKKRKRRGAQLIKNQAVAPQNTEPMQTAQPTMQTAQQTQNVQFNQTANTNQSINSESASPYQTSTQNAVVEQPRYFRVKQNRELIMAEYSDRYELYKISGGTLVKLRTDFK